MAKTSDLQALTVRFMKALEKSGYLEKKRRD